MNAWRPVDIYFTGKSNNWLGGRTWIVYDQRGVSHNKSKLSRRKNHITFEILITTFPIFGKRHKLLSQMMYICKMFHPWVPYQWTFLPVGMQDKSLCQTKLGGDKKRHHTPDIPLNRLPSLGLEDSSRWLTKESLLSVWVAFLFFESILVAK